MSVRFPNAQNSELESTELTYVVLVITVILGPEYWEMACTGTLIRSDLVLTTASCLMQFESLPDPINTVIIERPNGVERKAVKIFIHPRYYSTNYFREFDFAIISIVGSHQTEFPTLPQSGQHLHINTTGCVMGGYGNKVRFDLSNFKVIKFNETKWSILTTCRASSEKLCLHFSFIMPCRDDVGTPIICNGTLMAVYSPKIDSLTINCLESYVSYFSHVAESLQWIAAIVNSPDDAALKWLNNSWYFILLCVVVLVAMASIYYVLSEVMQWTIDVRDSLVPQTEMRASISGMSATSVRTAACTIPWMEDEWSGNSVKP